MTSTNPRVLRLNHLNRSKFRDSAHIEADFFYGKARNANLVSTHQHQFNPDKKGENNQHSQEIPDPTYNNNGTNSNYYNKSASVDLAPNSGFQYEMSSLNPNTGKFQTTRPITTYGLTVGRERDITLLDNEPLSLTTTIIPSDKSYLDNYRLRRQGFKTPQINTKSKLLDETNLQMSGVNPRINTASSDKADYRLANFNNEFSKGHNRNLNPRTLSHMETNIPSRHVFNRQDRFKIREDYYPHVSYRKYDVNEVDIQQSSYKCGDFNKYQTDQQKDIEKTLQKTRDHNLMKTQFPNLNGRSMEIKNRLKKETFVPSHPFYT